VCGLYDGFMGRVSGLESLWRLWRRANSAMVGEEEGVVVSCLSYDLLPVEKHSHSLSIECGRSGSERERLVARLAQGPSCRSMDGIVKIRG